MKQYLQHTFFLLMSISLVCVFPSESSTPRLKNMVEDMECSELKLEWLCGLIKDGRYEINDIKDEIYKIAIFKGKLDEFLSNNLDSRIPPINQDDVNRFLIILAETQSEPDLFNHGTHEERILNSLMNNSIKPDMKTIIKAIHISGPFRGRGFALIKFLPKDLQQTLPLEEKLKIIADNRWPEMSTERSRLIDLLPKKTLFDIFQGRLFPGNKKILFEVKLALSRYFIIKDETTEDRGMDFLVLSQNKDGVYGFLNGISEDDDIDEIKKEAMNGSFRHVAFRIRNLNNVSELLRSDIRPHVRYTVQNPRVGREKVNGAYKYWVIAGGSKLYIDHEFLKERAFPYES
ncbi:MAG: hypothetical protein HEEMFOPI_01045 [Holosporales bacterium]